MKKIAIVTSDNEAGLDAFYRYFRESGVEIVRLENLDDESGFEENKFDLCVLFHYNKPISSTILECCDFVNLHPSLLPAFQCEDAAEAAFKFGVKVSGVTVYKVCTEPYSGKILAQYPVFIDETMNLSEFKSEIQNVENALFAPVIKSILEDRLFSFSMLMKNENKGCGGCGGCKH